MTNELTAGQCLPVITLRYLEKARREIKPLTTEAVLRRFEEVEGKQTETKPMPTNYREGKLD